MAPSAAFGSWLGVSRTLTRAVACGTIACEASSKPGAWMPRTLIAGSVHSRRSNSPVPSRRKPSTAPVSAWMASSRTWPGGAPTGTGSWVRPLTATDPSSWCRLASSRARAVSASGSSPP
jgi:hypothetical protein